MTKYTREESEYYKVMINIDDREVLIKGLYSFSVSDKEWSINGYIVGKEDSYESNFWDAEKKHIVYSEDDIGWNYMVNKLGCDEKIYPGEIRFYLDDGENPDTNEIRYITPTKDSYLLITSILSPLIKDGFWLKRKMRGTIIGKMEEKIEKIKVNV